MIIFLPLRGISKMQLPMIKCDTYNCFQFLIVTVAKYYKRDYRLMMLELWGFSYDKTVDSTIGEKLKLCWSGRTKRRKQLLRYHGIDFNINYVADTIGFINGNIKKGPIAVFVDSFVCPWVPFYQKMHRSHAFFLLRCDVDSYYVFDQYCHDTKINKGFIKNNVISIITFNQNEADLYDIKDKIRENLREWKEYGFSQYAAFVEDMEHSFSTEKEIGEDPTESKLVMHLKNLSEDRLNFIEAVEFFEEAFRGDLSVVKKIFQEISIKYQKLRAYIIKYFFYKKYHRKKLLQKR